MPVQLRTHPAVVPGARNLLADDLDAGDILALAVTDPQSAQTTLEQLQIWLARQAGVQEVDTLADLKLLADGADLAFTLGYFARADGGGGPPWKWIEGSAATADDFMVVQSSVRTDGRWHRIFVSGANTSPMWAGCGLGLADDSSRFQKVLNFPAAIDASGATYRIMNLSVAPGNLCPGIFSDGSGILVPPVGATFSDFGITVTKLTAFYFRNLRIVMPSSTNPVVAPTFNRMIWFSTTGDDQVGVDWEVSDCNITGGLSAIVVGGRARNFRATDNYITATWGDGISGPNVPDGAYICDNELVDGGYATGAPQPAGAIRIGSSTSAHAGADITINRNHIVRYSVNAAQSAIDCFSNALYNADISDNIIEDCGSGIELKTVPAPAGALDVYQALSVRNNKVRLLPSASTSAISIFHAGADDDVGKGANVFIEGNDVSCPTRPPSGNGVYGIIVSGFSDVTILTNWFINVTHGISIAGVGTTDDTQYRTYIANNTIDAVSAAIVTASGFITGLYISGNPMLKAQFRASIELSAGTINDISIDSNYIWSTNTAALEIRDVHNGSVRDNDIVGGTNAMVTQGTPPSDVLIEENRIATTYDTIPAVSGVVTNPGIGLTDGARYFTVTNGTGTVPTVFSCVVSGGVITGPVVIQQPGMYSVFPTVPTVTVDEGIVGGAAFTLTGAVASVAGNFGVGTDLVVRNNTIDVPVTARTMIGGGGYVLANNLRGTVSADPTPTYGASIGDVFQNSNPGVNGIKEWYCVTAGNPTAAVFNTVRLQSLVVATPTQSSSKSTTVTGNGRSGTITMNAANLVADTAVSFTFNNNQLAIGDALYISYSSGGTAGSYLVEASGVTTGSCTVTVRNVTAGDLAQAIVLNFVVLKG